MEKKSILSEIIVQAPKIQIRLVGYCLLAVWYAASDTESPCFSAPPLFQIRHLKLKIARRHPNWETVCFVVALWTQMTLATEQQLKKKK